MEEKAVRKEAFFKELFQFDDDRDDEPLDSYDVASIPRHCKARAASHVSPPLLPSAKDRFLRSVKGSTPLARTTSAPLPGVKTPLTAENNVVYETPPLILSRLRKVPELNGLTSPRPGRNGPRQRVDGASGMPKASKKRKRGQSLDMMPQSQQIFKGLGFCTPS